MPLTNETFVESAMVTLVGKAPKCGQMACSSLLTACQFGAFKTGDVGSQLSHFLWDIFHIAMDSDDFL